MEATHSSFIYTVSLKFFCFDVWLWAFEPYPNLNSAPACLRHHNQSFPVIDPIFPSLSKRCHPAFSIRIELEDHCGWFYFTKMTTAIVPISHDHLILRLTLCPGACLKQYDMMEGHCDDFRSKGNTWSAWLSFWNPVAILWEAQGIERPPVVALADSPPEVPANKQQLNMWVRKALWRLQYSCHFTGNTQKTVHLLPHPNKNPCLISESWEILIVVIILLRY